MSQSQAQIKAADGVATVHVFQPAGKGPWPAAIIFMDAFGPRPGLFQMADRLASAGYYVLLPDLFYRSGPYAPFNAATAFTDPAERDRLTKLFVSINSEMVTRDTGAYLAYLSEHPDVARSQTGCVGYCLGGAFALWAAATYPDRVLAAASFHGARLATDKPDSPHLLAAKMKGEIYIGVAGIDPHFPEDERTRLEHALTDGHVDHTIEIYENVRHGFAVNDTLAYDRDASERHWSRLLELFGRNLHHEEK
jgi:carboxymethylenebutenolidase